MIARKGAYEADRREREKGMQTAMTREWASVPRQARWNCSSGGSESLWEAIVACPGSNNKWITGLRLGIEVISLCPEGWWATAAMNEETRDDWPTIFPPKNHDQALWNKFVNQLLMTWIEISNKAKWRSKCWFTKPRKHPHQLVTARSTNYHKPNNVTHPTASFHKHTRVMQIIILHCAVLHCIKYPVTFFPLSF